MRTLHWLALALGIFLGGVPVTHAQSGMAMEGSSTLRLVGYFSIDGRPSVVLANARANRDEWFRLEAGERYSPQIECLRIDPVAGICVVSEGQTQHTLRLPLALDSGVGEICLWLTNCTADVASTLLGQINQCTVLAPDGLEKTRIPSLISRTTFKADAVKELVRVYEQQGITLRQHGPKMMVALRKEGQERYLKVLPAPPVSPAATQPDSPKTPASGFTRSGSVRAGAIKFLQTPLEMVAGIYADLSLQGRQLSRAGGSPARKVDITLRLMTDATTEEVKHMLEVVFLLNGLKVELVGDKEFKLVEW